MHTGQTNLPNHDETRTTTAVGTALTVSVGMPAVAMSNPWYENDNATTLMVDCSSAHTRALPRFRCRRSGWTNRASTQATTKDHRQKYIVRCARASYVE